MRTNLSVQVLGFFIYANETAQAVSIGVLHEAAAVQHRLRALRTPDHCCNACLFPGSLQVVIPYEDLAATP
jgi:hypothetical protein